MADSVEVQVFIDDHYKECVAALRRIALLADTGSEEHKAEFAKYYLMGGPPSGWRVAETMREIAIEVTADEYARKHKIAKIVQRLQSFIRKNQSPGQCQILSDGINCPCLLCDVSRLAGEALQVK